MALALTKPKRMILPKPEPLKLADKTKVFPPAEEIFASRIPLGDYKKLRGVLMDLQLHAQDEDALTRAALVQERVGNSNTTGVLDLRFLHMETLKTIALVLEAKVVATGVLKEDGTINTTKADYARAIVMHFMH